VKAIHTNNRQPTADEISRRRRLYVQPPYFGIVLKLEHEQCEVGLRVVALPPRIGTKKDYVVQVKVSSSRHQERVCGCNRGRTGVCAADRRCSGPRKRETLTHLSIWLVSHVSEKPVLDHLVEVRDLIKGAFGRGGLCDLEFEDAGLITDPRVVIPWGARTIAQI